MFSQTKTALSTSMQITCLSTTLWKFLQPQGGWCVTSSWWPSWAIWSDSQLSPSNSKPTTVSLTPWQFTTPSCQSGAPSYTGITWAPLLGGEKSTYNLCSTVKIQWVFFGSHSWSPSLTCALFSALDTLIPLLVSIRFSACFSLVTNKILKYFV
jgi:hypothetical protein